VRLIDADALKSKIREQPWKRETKVSLILEWIYTLIDEASTVQNEALQAENERLKATIDEIKGIVGYPGEEALKKHGLTDTLPNIVRYLHREWLEQTHKAGQRCIEKDIEIDKLKDENEQLRAQVARMREALDELTSELDYAHLLQNGIEWDKHKSVAFDKALDILNMKPIDYHNPADVEALRKAREAIQKAYDNYELIGEYEYDISSYLEEALAEIDRAIGGGQ